MGLGGTGFAFFRVMAWRGVFGVPEISWNSSLQQHALGAVPSRPPGFETRGAPRPESPGPRAGHRPQPLEVHGVSMLDQEEFYSSRGSYSYLVSSRETDGAILIDPTPDLMDIYATHLRRVGREKVFTLETGSVRASREASSAIAGSWEGRTVVPCDLLEDPDLIRVGHGDSIELAGIRLEVLGRLGRPNDAVSYLFSDRVFIGGRRAYEEPELLGLPPETTIYRSHAAPGENRQVLATSLGALSTGSSAFQAMPVADESIGWAEGLV